MFIKNVIISGFRSYRDQSFPDSLSSKVNVLTGKNGSGKSNFFDAVQFVLSERFTQLSSAQRKALFHVGSGRPSLSAFVEVVFDNSDGRLVIPGRANEAEVRIRRTVGLKQDEFRVNDRKFTAEEVRQLLESAGFSSGNPYYVVEQGKISTLASMDEKTRYQVIKDIAGTKVYESRRADTERILAETELKKAQIDKSMLELRRRLTELESETSELKEMQQVDQEKKLIEYYLCIAELKDASETLTLLERDLDSAVASLRASEDSESTSDLEVASWRQKLTDVTLQVSRVEGERATLEAEMSALSRRHAVVEVDATDASGRASRCEHELSALTQEKVALEKSLEAAKMDKEAKRRLLHAREGEARQALEEVEESQRKLERLQERRNRTRLFACKADRDAWLNKELTRNREVATRTKGELQTTERDLESVQELIETEQQRQVSTEASNRDRSNADAVLSLQKKRISAVLQERDSLSQQRRNMWRGVHDQEAVVRKLEEEQQNARHALARAVRHDIRDGLQSLSSVLQELKDARLSRAVHGPLIDLITVEAGFETVVEVTAGGALFNVVVDTFDDGARLLDEFNKRRKPGRVTFFALDVCKGVVLDIPSTPDSSPLLKRLRYAEKFHGVVAEVFGRTAVATSLDVGARLFRDLRCDVVTLDGDQLSRKGGVTGGYVDQRNMKLRAYIKEKSVASELASERRRLDELCQDVARVEQSITEVLNTLETLRTEVSTVETDADVALRGTRVREERVSRLKTQLHGLEATKQSLQRSMAETESVVAQLTRELKEDFKTSWSAAEEAALERLSADVLSRKVTVSNLQAQALQLATEVQLQEDSVTHLERRITTVADRIRELGWVTSRGTSAELSQEHGVMRAEVASLTARLKENEKTLETLLKEKQSLEAQLEAFTAKQLSSAMGLQTKQTAFARTQAQRAVLLQRRDEAQQRIRRLGALPPDGERFASLSVGKLMHNLKLLNERSKKYSHVNRRAADQHAALVASVGDLESQRSSLESELVSIHDLIQHLDQKKDEAMERTYKQIQYQFEEVFKELIVGEQGSAELQLVRSGGGNVSFPNGDGSSDNDPYCAARIRVSFGLRDRVTELDQLSGGQKSLVALALIFAIQRCDPAPFYLFDEIDAALDPEYRTAVAAMIGRQSETCQFIVASFKTEMLEIADRVLGIFFHNKVSQIQAISKEEGVKLLKQAALEDRKRSREAEDDGAEGSVNNRV